jgi:hypothetical protein
MEGIIESINKELMQYGVLGIFALVSVYFLVKLFIENTKLNAKLVEVLKENGDKIAEILSDKATEIAAIHKDYYEKNTQADIRRDEHVKAISSNFLTEIQRLHSDAATERKASIDAYRLLSETNKALEVAISKLAETQKDTGLELKQVLLRGSGNGR